MNLVLPTPSGFEIDPLDPELLRFPLHPPADRGPYWVQIISGAPFWPMAPHPDDIRIEDIAWALARLPRSNGHVRGADDDPDAVYTVGAHCLALSEAVERVEPSAALAALVDDFEEAYIGDSLTPLTDGYPAFRQVIKAIKLRLKACIAVAFNLPWPFPPIIKQLDQRILYNERGAILNPPLQPWIMEREPIPDLVVRGWRPTETYQRLLDRFHQLDADPRIPRFHHPRG